MPAGYSGTPLWKKLGLGPGKSQTLVLIAAPKGFEAELGGAPDDAAISRRASAKRTPDIILSFVDALARLEKVLEDWEPRIAGAEMLWIAWPKKSSGVVTDVTENLVRERALQAGLVDVKVCAVTDVWSGLKLVRPVKDRIRDGAGS
jgi:hypothetical protein